MAHLFSCALYIALFWTSLAFSEFTEPSTANGDFSEKFLVGETVHISWANGWWYGALQEPDVVSLWIAWFDDPTNNPFTKLLQSNISIHVPGRFDWTVDLDDSILNQSTRFHFRLIAQTGTPIYSLTVPRLPSRGFNIFPASTSSIATLSTVASTSTTLSTPASTTETTPSSGKKTSNNTGAIAGGIVGGLAGLGIICVIALLLLRRVKQKRKAKVSEMSDTYDSKRDAPPRYATPELEDATRYELAGPTNAPERSTAELEGSIPKK